MSGGSFEYLCHRDASDIFKDGEIVRMADALDQCGHLAKNVAERTRALIDLRDKLDAEIIALAPVWRAVEWRDSGDVGPDRVFYEIGKIEAPQT